MPRNARNVSLQILVNGKHIRIGGTSTQCANIQYTSNRSGGHGHLFDCPTQTTHRKSDLPIPPICTWTNKIRWSHSGKESMRQRLVLAKQVLSESATALRTPCRSNRVTLIPRHYLSTRPRANRTMPERVAKHKKWRMLCHEARPPRQTD